MSEGSRLDFTELARSAQRMAGEVADVQADMMEFQATGFGGGGLVRATVSGEGAIIALDIDPSIIDPNDPETLSSLIIEAVASANQSMAEQRAKRLNEVTQGIGGLMDRLAQKQDDGERVVPQFPSLRDTPRHMPRPGGAA